MTRAFPRPRLRSCAVALAATALIVPVAAGLGSSAADGAAPSMVSVSPNGMVNVLARGNGHGHGMSQYGARGAAMKGLTYQQIVAFYYRHTALSTRQFRKIRILLSGYGSTTTVAANNQLDLTVNGADRLLSTAPARYRLIAAPGGTLTLQQLPQGPRARWSTVTTGLPDQTSFHAPNWSPIQIYSPDGTSALYYGRLVAVRSGRGVVTVNKVSIDRYTAGVAPYEMPSGWPQAAVEAQAVAARTYGVYALEHPQGSFYDICDTTMCQVYGGHQQRNAQNVVTSSDDMPVAMATSNQVLTYQGQPIFAQFSASNGGWEDSGGQPYLPAQRDPYDTAASGDPYVAISEKVSANSIASYFGLAKLTGITVTSRDGNGQWGGRVESLVLTGKNAAGAVQRVNADGFDMQDALGLGTTWFTITSTN